ncbi:hypothetical protein CSKR_100759 [Clonorchis sinensis]|uniref:Uncharacterized protein n=1 Tax=Clonorchis sinensis TaxID=79923 RepID=A0A3R7C444_CLOSI|nr:hypothetical protein CSKR_100759 [Clonorchis sinensis]
MDDVSCFHYSEEDDNRPDYRYTGCAPVTQDKEVASREDNHRSVCGSLGRAPTTMDSKPSSEDNGAHSHCVFLGCAPLTTCEQAVPPTMGTGFCGKPVYPSAEVTQAGDIYFRTVSTQCLRTCLVSPTPHSKGFDEPSMVTSDLDSVNGIQTST